MADKLQEDLTQSANDRPSLHAHHSSSLPSTPYQYARDLNFNSRSPSPVKRHGSPRSVHSETNNASFRRPLGGCKFETGMTNFKRRMPYSLGGDKLEAAKVPPKKNLDPKEEQKVTTDMKALYSKIIPTAENEERRRKFVRKLSNLLDAQWPRKGIKVHVFGSSGNRLGTSDSDVDICITTPMKELENVCILAKFLADHGMERVICVSHAKVPIVKIWDPELSIACDMNVNNTLAIENTRMIRTYVDIDERVRPLAMIIKHWTRRRKINDAAFGGTLSSYTWICMIINFLQTRSPPILPVLQQRPHQRRITPTGELSSFADDIDSLRGFGKQNKETLGELLYQFFRRYGHEIDYEKVVVSVRLGKLISKSEKGWHMLQNNRLCVEEPFNISRNLGNTADDISFRGLHMELRRACDLIAAVDLEACCEQYEYPPEEERLFEKPLVQSKPVIMQPAQSAPRNNKNGVKAPRHNGYRGANVNKRTSSATSSRFNVLNGPHFNQMSSPSREYFMQSQQFQLHDQLFQQYQLLQAQEQELRIQLHRQAQAQAQILAQTQARRRDDEGEGDYSGPQDEYHSRRPGTVNAPPLSAPLRPAIFSPSIQYMPIGYSFYHGASTNPPSPSLQAIEPEPRRSLNRQMYANGGAGSARAQSQPARSPSTSHHVQTLAAPESNSPHNPQNRQKVGDADAGAHARPGAEYMSNGIPISKATAIDSSLPKEYVGYFFGPPFAALPFTYGVLPQSYPQYSGDSVSRGRHMAPNADKWKPETFQLSRPPPPSRAHVRQRSASVHGQNPSKMRSDAGNNFRADPSVSSYGGPLIVNGSLGSGTVMSKDLRVADRMPMATSENASTTDDVLDTPSSNSDTISQGPIEPAYQDLGDQHAVGRTAYDAYVQLNPKYDHLGIANGTTSFVNATISVSERSSRVSAQENRQETQRHQQSNHNTNGEQVRTNPRRKQTKRDVDDASVDALSVKLNGTAILHTDKANTSSERHITFNGKAHVARDGENTSSSKSNSSPRKDGSRGQQQTTESQKAAQNLSPSKAFHGSNPNTAGGWQQTSRRKNNRKRTKSLSLSNIPAGGPEPLPADLSQRKGG